MQCDLTFAAETKPSGNALATQGNVSTGLAKHLGVDKFAPMDDATRPDLVFVMADSDSPNVLNVIELKSPSIPLDNEHLTQLETYMAKLSAYAEVELGKSLTVHGWLIGAMPDATKTNDKQLLLLDRIKKAQPSSPWMVLGVRELLARTLETHHAVIASLQSDLNEEEEPDPGLLQSPDMTLALTDGAVEGEGVMAKVLGLPAPDPSGG